MLRVAGLSDRAYPSFISPATLSPQGSLSEGEAIFKKYHSIIFDIPLQRTNFSYQVSKPIIAVISLRYNFFNQLIPLVKDLLDDRRFIAHIISITKCCSFSLIRTIKDHRRRSYSLIKTNIKPSFRQIHIVFINFN